MDTIKNIVSSEWLHSHLSDSDLVILEVHQSKNKAGLSTDIVGNIFGSIRVELKPDFSDPNGQFSNTFPSVNQFEASCSRLGISNESKVVIVDRLGIYTSPRLWFLFRAMGHKNIAVLDGGLMAWVDEGYELVSKLNDPKEKTNYTAQLNTKFIKYIDDVKQNVRSMKSTIIDARSSDRFLSLVAEPRVEIRSGNIPNSINIPFKSLLNGYKYKSYEQLNTIFKKHNLKDKSMIFSCGSGVTACIVMLAAIMVNNNPKSIYDGSWTEWATLTKENDFSIK